ncbi:GNAT family N-acetyltransferase [Parvularcula oceani]|uniref:GNAT family N-acetyltransferase n=1 Tax=Parvularcula oceani TaxID=1247963 RepID=UPI00068ED4D7|nr:GNAT family N-acetyltransferase [Parvularcula oceani]
MRDIESEIRADLRDGTPVLIRQIRPEDKQHLEMGLRQLSPESQHFRFFAAKDEFSEEELRFFTEVDHHDHDAWGALDLSRDPPAPIGIARYVRHEPGGDTAEFAVTILDSHQKRGLGSLLLGVIAARAKDNGISRLHSVELADNHPLFDVLAGLDTEKHFRGEGEEEVTVQVYADPAAYPATQTGDAMRRAYALYEDACRR